MPRYVILEHDHPQLHWDFMLEAGDVLRTWRLGAQPQPGQLVAALALGNHRAVYLDYEGQVSGNRGRVQRWDAGTFSWLRDDSGSVEVLLRGRRLHGRAVLTRIQGDEWSFKLGDTDGKIK